MKQFLSNFRKSKKTFVIWVFFLMALVGMMQTGGIAAPMFFNGHYYDSVSTGNLTITWDAANAAAESSTYNGWGGHLVTLTSQAENDWVMSSFDNPTAAWLGGYQDTTAGDYSEPSGGWRWVTGEEWDYTNWQSGEPNEWNNNGEDHLATAKTPIDDDLYWNDRGNDTNSYLVEYEPVATPEPATMVLFGSGLLGFAAGFKRKKRS